jgi:hypothetical protein
MRKEEGTSDYCRYSNIDLALIIRWEVDGGHRWLTAETMTDCGCRYLVCTIT